MKGNGHILYRRLKAFGNRLLFLLCSIFPIHQNRVVFCSYEGKGGFGCNPKYVAEALHRMASELDLLWLVNDRTKPFPEYIKKIPNTTLSRAYFLSTARIWIDNYRTRYGTRKRKGQYYLNLNHYNLGIKSTGYWRGEGFSKMAELVSKSDSEMIDAVVIDSEWSRAVFPKGLLYDGPFLKFGSPRCDILYGDRTGARARFREKHRLAKETKILLFAPTFRERARNGKRSVYSETWSLDFAKLLEDLEEKFGGAWVLCIKVHPQVAETFSGYQDSKLKGRLIDESRADDLYEILAAADALVTDYSSVCFEAGYARIPVFLYADDVEEYTKNRGSLYWDFSTDFREPIKSNPETSAGFDLTFPFPLARTQTELTQAIQGFDQQEYESRLKNFFQNIGLTFDGKAAERVARHLLEILLLRSNLLKIEHMYAIMPAWKSSAFWKT